MLSPREPQGLWGPFSWNLGVCGSLPPNPLTTQGLFL